MRGFLSKFLRNSRGDQSPSVQSRQEPTLTARPKDDRREINEALHPDEEFIDYEATNDASVVHDPLGDDEKNSDHQATGHIIADSLEHDNFDDILQEQIQHKKTTVQEEKDLDPFEPPQGFNSSWMKSIQENKVIKSLSIKTTLDERGNTFIHYAAAFGKSHILRRLIEDGWDLERQNYSGKTPYDFAINYKNSVNTYFIENIRKGLKRASGVRDQRSQEDENNADPSVVNAVGSTQADIGSLPNQDWRTLVDTSKCPKDFWGHKYDTSAIDKNGNTLLHYATIAGNKPYTLHLLGLGWAILKKNSDGHTPLDFAEIGGHVDLVETLKQLYKDFIAEKSLSEAEGEPAETGTSFSNNSIQALDQKNEVSDLDLTIDEISQEVEEPKDKFNLSCVKCEASFSEVNTAIKLRFCPFCGAAQPDAHASIITTQSQFVANDGNKNFPYDTAYNLQPDSLEEVTLNKGTYASIAEPDDTEQTPVVPREDFDTIPKITSATKNQQQHQIFTTDSLSQKSFDEIDEVYHDDNLYVDLENYQPASLGRKSFDKQNGSSIIWPQSPTKGDRMEEWEIFLDEDLEEQSHPSDQYFEDEDPLEQGAIVEYASRLTSRITYYRSKDRRKIYAIFVTILGDFPFYQSYAAIERLIARDVQIDRIQDAYLVKLMWMTSPNIWSTRRFNRTEHGWLTFRNPKLKNSMSWQLASDLVIFCTPNELENLILNDWYTEWLNLPLQGGGTASGIDPAYSQYPTYLHEKRRLLTSNMNTW